MSVYIVAQIAIEDREEYAKYEAGFVEVFLEHRGRVLSVSESPEVIEGSWPYTRTVILEFPSRDEAMGWYESPDYQAIVGHRQAASSANIVIVDRLEQ